MARQDPALTVTASDDSGTSLIAVTGELDLATAPTLRDAMQRLLERDDVPDLCVDASGVTFADSSGLAVLLMGAREWGERQRTFVLRAPSAQLSRLLDLAGARRAFSVEP